MNKNTEIQFVGQPIFSQLMKLVQAVNLKGIIDRHHSDYYYKAFSTQTHLTTLLFGIFSRCDSLGEICEGLRAMSGKLNHLDLDKAPAKSTVSDGMRKRSHQVFEELYFKLADQYQCFLSDSRTLGLTFKEVLLIDSTTIRLFSDLLKGVGRNPKGGLKVHMLIDAVQSIGRFVKLTPAKEHDRKFLAGLKLHKGSMVVCDRAYNDYQQFAEWTAHQVYFVTRLKKNAVYEVTQTLRRHYRKKGKAKVLSDQTITLTYYPDEADGTKQNTRPAKLNLRKVSYQDEKDRYYEFLTNHSECSAEEVAFLYKKRWGIELLFKKMKQNFQLHYFYGENVNAIYTQVWCTLIAQLLMTVVQKQARTKKAFSVVASLVRIHLISMLDVFELLRSTNRSYSKPAKSPPTTEQLPLKFKEG